MIQTVRTTPALREPLIVFILALIPITAALISQYGFGLYPCELCHYQRLPYYVIMALSALVFGFHRTSTLKFFLSLAALLFFANAGIAFFHMGVEYKWWEGLDSCSATLGNTVAALKAAIMGAPTARCDEAQFTFILTMAGWNCLYALGAMCYCLWRVNRLK